MNRKDKIKMQKIHKSKDIHKIKGITKKQNCAKIELKKEDINSIEKGQDRKREFFGQTMKTILNKVKTISEVKKQKVWTKD